MSTAAEIAEKIKASKNLVFLTGAGVSTPSGIPDYRSMEGIYTKSGLKQPEYLLSHWALIHDTKNFYTFVKQLFHPEAGPNVIHQAIADLEKGHAVTVITQNIDGLHRKAGSSDVVEFHGTIVTCHCEKCGHAAGSEEFLQSYIHKACGGILRPDIVLYDEMIDPANITRSAAVLTKADTIMIVGTTFRVYPFAALINYAGPQAKIYAVNKDSLTLPNLEGSYLGDAQEVFEKL